MSEKTILDYETVALDDENSALVIIDQTKLPGKTQIISLKTGEEIWDAIYLLKVRGAPAIGVAAAFGIYLLAKQIKEDDYTAFYQEFLKQKAYLNSARPTAVNLSWALNRMDRLCQSMSEKPIPEIVEALKREAIAIKEEDIQVCRAIGEYGLSLVKPGDGILTHCNAGQLATCKYGTATAPIYLGQERGYHFRVFADETRPLLQGARLTAYELFSAGVDVTLICDNMSATVMKNGWVNAVFVGCDRVAANGDAANKIGTSVVATVAKRYNVPVYICAPTSTIDMNTPTGADITIEQRPAHEVTEMWYKERMAPEGIKVFNPAFDVTDHDLIAGIVTEYGVARAPYTESLQEIFKKREAFQGKGNMQMEYMTKKQAKKAIIDIGQRMYVRGFVAANDGNISVKTGDNEVWATPTGVSKGFMKKKMLVKVDLDGNVLEGTYKPSSELKMHLRAYQENPDIKSVCHAHPPICTCFAIAGIPLDAPILAEAIITLGDVPIAPYAELGSKEVPEVVAPFCHTHNGILLANHGAVTWAEDAYAAYYRLESMEYYANILLITEKILEKQNLLSNEQVDALLAMREKFGVKQGGVPRKN